MKKKLFCLILCAVFLLTAVPVVQARAAICFVAMNDAVPLVLTDGAAPYYTKGKLYLPYTAFDVSPNGVGASYNAEQNTFVLFNADETLIFNLQEDTYTDKRNKTYDVDVSYRSGLLYVPASVASHFNLSVTMLTSRAGYPIIRFTNGGQVYDDGMFVAQAEKLITDVAQKYENEASVQDPGPGVSTEQPTEEPPVEVGPVEVYLAFRGEAVSQETLDRLNHYEIKAAFFLTEEQILLERDLVRAIYADGHTVGLAAAAGETDSAAALIRANDALDQVIFRRSALALASADAAPEMASCRVITEPIPVTVEELLEMTQETRLYVVDGGALGVIESLVNAGASMLRLLETTQLG